ncbi:MAG: hypothetical protein KJP17_07085 [Gammaproteobacteria bacterium]|nr:hypothetical protein [Gammaproteobacteria bacterium]
MASPLVDKGHSVFREWFRKVWEVRGGGLYACGFAATFIILEIGSLGEDLANVGSFLTGGFIATVISFLVDFIIDSFTNTLYALIWPVFVVQWAPPWGAIGLGLTYFGFATYLKQPVTDWLFDGEPDPAREPKQS